MATITGSSGSDVLVGTTGDDIYMGFYGGNDVVWDLGGYDTYIVNANWSDLIGDTEDDGTGSLILNFVNGNSLTLMGVNFDEEWGKSWGSPEKVQLNDFLFQSGTEAGESMNFFSWTHRVSIEAQGGDDTVIGSAFNDEISGGEGSDSVNAAAGDDELRWWGGNNADVDTIDGGTGTDRLLMDGGWGLSVALVTVVDEAASAFRLQSFEAENAPQLWFSNIEKVIGQSGILQVGSQGNDTLTGADGVSGDEDIDSEWSLSTTDVLFGRGGDDVLSGGVGDDILHGGSGIDTLDGGDGNDTYHVDSAADSIIDSGGNDKVFSTASFTLGAGIETLHLQTTGPVTGTGNGGVNNLFGGSGNDSLYGKGGNDFIEGGLGDDLLDGGAGADVLQGGEGSDTYYIDSVDDRLADYGRGFDSVYSTVSVDVDALTSDSYNPFEQVVLLGSSNLVITDVAVGDSANRGCWMVGNAGANTITGNGGADKLDGGTGADSLVGGTGSDTYYIDNTGDVAKELAGEGADTAYASVSWTMSDNVEYLVLTGSTAINGTGNAGNNFLFGNGAANKLSGFGGADTLVGGASADTLNGGKGNDYLDGGNGADRFLFDTALSGTGNVDHVLSFVAGTDRIQVDDAIFAAAGPLGIIAAASFHNGTKAADADDRFIYDAATGSLYYDADGNGVASKLKFAVIDNHAVISATDIQVV